MIGPLSITFKYGTLGARASRPLFPRVKPMRARRPRSQGSYVIAPELVTWRPAGLP